MSGQRRTLAGMTAHDVPVVVAAVGQYGPFDDGRTIPWTDLVDGDGGGVFRCTIGEGVNPPRVLATGHASVSFQMRDDGKLRRTLRAFTEGKVAVKEAA